MVVRFVFIALALLAGVAGARAAAFDADVEAALSAVAESDTPAERIRADVRYLADDDRNGREAGSEGYLAAARYVAARFDVLGLKPVATGGWFQPVKFRSAKRDPAAARMEVIATGGQGRELAHLEDFLIGRSFTQASFDVTAPAVFVGFGVVDRLSGLDDYEGLDVKGKIVVAFGGAPASFDSERRAYAGSSEQKLKTAAARGAVGFLSIRTKLSEQRTPWSRIVVNPRSVAMTWIGPGGAVHEEAPQIVATAALSAAGAAKLFAGSPKSFAEVQAEAAEGAVRGFELAASVRLRGASALGESESPNVVGVIEGADPQLRNEAVVLTAHLDHLGVRPANKAGDDVVNNGAIDNALGVATFLDVARAFKESVPPRRSIVIVALTAEEKGLLGADYFARYPATGGRRIVANVNLDMPMALYPFTDVIAFGAEHSSIGRMVGQAAAGMGVSVSPDPIPEEGIFTRSDHYRFVEQGVPSVYIMLGYQNGGEAAFEDFLRNHYHRPSDQVTLPIDFEQAARFAQLNYLIARAIADADEAPSWNEGDFFGDLFAK